MPPATPPATITLRFAHMDSFEHVSTAIHEDLSAAARHGEALFVSCDETAGIDRLTPEGDGVWGNHAHFNLGDIVPLPEGPAGEMDIEGLDCDGDWLWIAGSHSLKRSKAKPDRDPAANLDRMAKIKRDPNRYFLARVPLVPGEGGPAPVAEDGERRAAWVKLKRKSSKLIGWLEEDPHLGPWLTLPSKEGGFDIEGCAARGLRVWLGLRGPVMRDHAVILEMEMKITGKGHLKPRRIDGPRRYRKHLIPAAGEGIRDLEIAGEDLLILTGPVGEGDGRSDILRWRNFMRAKTSGVVPPETVCREIEMPYRGPVDHPEGLVAWPEEEGLLVVYDSPAAERLPEPETVLADIWRLDG